MQTQPSARKWKAPEVEEYKRNIRPTKKEKEDENLTELEYCRKYSKTRSMGQD